MDPIFAIFLFSR